MSLDQIVSEAQEALEDRERESLWLRGVTDEQIREFRIGYSDDPLPLSGACSNMSDVFLFPLTTPLGEIGGVQLRYRAEKGYRDFFSHQEEPVLFGLAQAMPHIWRTGEIWLVEGVYDLFVIQRTHPGVVSTLKAGVPNVLLPLLHRIVDRVVLAFDNDSAGDRGAEFFRKSHGREFDTARVQYPSLKMVDGKTTKDPSDLWEVWGADRFGDFLKQYD